MSACPVPVYLNSFPSVSDSFTELFCLFLVETSVQLSVPLVLKSLSHQWFIFVVSFQTLSWLCHNIAGTNSVSFPDPFQYCVKHTNPSNSGEILHLWPYSLELFYTPLVSCRGRRTRSLLFSNKKFKFFCFVIRLSL